MRRKRLRYASESTLWNLSVPGGFCGSLVLKSIKLSVINIQRSICSLFRLCGVSHEHRFWPRASSLIVEETLAM